MDKPDIVVTVNYFLEMHAKIPKHKIQLLVSELQSALSDQPYYAEAIQRYIASSSLMGDIIFYLGNNQQVDLLIKFIIKMQGLSIGKISTLPFVFA